MVNSDSNQYRPDFVSHPGATLKDALEEIGLSQADLATRMGRPVKTISEVINGKASITPETAVQLELVVGIPATFWNSREKAYREFLVLKKKKSEWEEQKEWTSLFPLNDLFKYGFVPKVKEPSEQVKYVLQFLGVNSRDQWATVFDQYSMAFRRSSAFDANDYALGAWLRAGVITAQNQALSPYSKELFVEALHAARSLTTEEPEVFQPEIQRMCSKAGVAVVFVPQFKKSLVSGATRWLTPHHGLIQLSIRYKTNDHLWFTFFHEAAHLLLHGKKLIFLDTGKNEGELELEANAWATNFLIPENAYREFLNAGTFNKAAIIEFAEQIGIAAGIVVGRLQHDRYLQFSHCNDLKVRFEWIEKRAS